MNDQSTEKIPGNNRSELSIGLGYDNNSEVQLGKKIGTISEIGETRNTIDKIMENSVNGLVTGKKITDFTDKIKDFLNIDRDGVLKFKSNNIFKNIPYKNVERALLEAIEEVEKFKGIKVKSIDFSSFNNEENKYIKEKIFNIIGNNYPLVEIARLEEGVNVIDITFLGVKNLNDSISKEFVDLFNGKLKDIFRTNFAYYGQNSEKHGRIIRDNYKHMTFTMDVDGNISKGIFGGETNKIELLENIFESLTDVELDDVLKESKVKDKKEIKNILFSEFDFGIGTSVVEKTDKSGLVSILDKNKAFHGAEIASRKKADLNNLGKNLEFNFDDVRELAGLAIEKEAEIVHQFKKQKFNYNGTSFDIIVDGRINNILLRSVRKGEDIGNIILNGKVKDYIDYLNAGFDFIAPFIYKSQLEEISDIEQQIKDGIIDIELLQNTYKGTLSIDCLKAKSKGKEGLRVFIDIVDMGIMNLIDFRRLAGDIVTGKIKKINIEKLFEAGNPATYKFQNLIKLIKEDYKNADISLGGDEVFIFIPGKTEDETTEIVTNISTRLDEQGLIGRISNSTNNSNEKIFDQLDGFTPINKLFEKVTERVINNNPHLMINDDYNSEIFLSHIKFSSVNINIEQSLEGIISNNINDFIYDLREEISSDSIKDILSGNINSYIIPLKVYKSDRKGNITGKLQTFKVKIEKGKNNEGLLGNKELIITIK